MTFTLCNPESNYTFEKWLPDYVIRNIVKGQFGNLEIYGGERRRYGGARRNSPSLYVQNYFGPCGPSCS